jgi:hypothetical protein
MPLSEIGKRLRRCETFYADTAEGYVRSLVAQGEVHLRCPATPEDGTEQPP